MTNMATKCGHLARTLQFINARNAVLNNPRLRMTGSKLTVPALSALAASGEGARVEICDRARARMRANARYLEDKVASGSDIYGVNTGFGGSADVRSDDIVELQKSLIRHLNAGFGDKLPSDLVKTVMAVRINSLSCGYSGVRASTVQLLADMLNHDIIPVVPKRGSVSASGDLMPTSYIAACMMGRQDAMVTKNGVSMCAPDALRDAGLEPVTFQAKEALAVINSASFASSLAALVLYDANIAVVLTQVATALTVESLRGRVESFHPTIHRCLPHPGQAEVAMNIMNLLENSKFAIQIGEQTGDRAGLLKQDRYALRSSPQWLGPVLETMLESVRRVTIELNSANDNPLIDHEADAILHGANFQGTSVTVAMDQARQGVQLCGKLLLGQFQELINAAMNSGLTPNLAGADVNTDFGFKGMDTAMASYQSELDYLTNSVTNHVLSTELHNQAVNSMALVSARYTKRALDILQMMIANIMCAQLQAIDLRFMKSKAERLLDEMFDEFGVTVSEPIRTAFPWYLFAFTPRSVTSQVLEHVVVRKHSEALFVDTLEAEMNDLVTSFQNGNHIDEVENLLGTGTRKVYGYLRREKGVRFYHAQTTPDTLLEPIHASITQHELAQLLSHLFPHVDVFQDAELQVNESDKIELENELKVTS